MADSLLKCGTLAEPDAVNFLMITFENKHAFARTEEHAIGIEIFKWNGWNALNLMLV